MACFGPGAAGARLEGSKAWAKALMVRNNIPTAAYHQFTTADEARAFCLAAESYPLVIKADGLAAGKGVTVCFSRDEANRAIADAMEQRKFGDAGGTVVIEEFMRGEEVSVHAVTDGETLLLLPSAQDHKRINDGDQGANTGGMGAYSPAPILTEKALDAVVRTILVPMLHALKREGIEYRGVLYAGLMLTRSGPKVIEWNVRFGDPETQVVFPRLRTDAARLLHAAATATLGELDGVDVDPRPVVGVVMASGGYPEAYPTGRPIRGLEQAAAMEGVTVIHAGTRKRDGAFQTAGGRVLTVTALGDDFVDARARAYRAVAAISWEAEHHRTDIAKRALEPVPAATVSAPAPAAGGRRAPERTGPGGGAAGRLDGVPRAFSPCAPPSPRASPRGSRSACSSRFPGLRRGPGRRVRARGASAGTARADAGRIREGRGARGPRPERRLSEVRFENASLEDVLTWLRTATGWNYVVKRAVVQKAGIDLAAIRVNLELHDVTVGLVLDFVLGHHGLVAKVEGNIVFVTTRADALGKPIFRLYDVRPLTWQKIDFVGPDLDLLPSGFDAGEAAPKEVPVEDDPFLDPQHIVDLVKEMVPGEWEAEGWSITATKTYLAVKAPRSIQRRVALAVAQMVAMK